MNNTAANEIDPVLFIWAALALVIILSAIAVVGLIREGKKKDRAKAMAAHPAGKARVTPIHPGWLAEDRIIPEGPETLAADEPRPSKLYDRAGYDWTK